MTFWMTRRLLRQCGMAAGLVCLILSLTGCVGLPEASPVSTGQAVNGSSDREAVAIEPNGPGDGDDPRQIVEGFMQAQISSEDNYAIAHEFLTKSASAIWRPGSASTIFGSESQISVTRPDVNTVAMSVPVVGKLSAEGRLERAHPGTNVVLRFGVTPTPSGWRITAVPRDMGVWVSEDDFLRTYVAESVYYPARAGTSLVPDSRWLPKTGLTTALARAALSAPSSWLKDAIASPFPAGSDLQVDSVPVNRSGVADISLTPQALSASAAQKAAMWAAMSATVGQDPSVSAININVRGRRLETDNLPTNVQNPRDVGFTLPASAVPSLIVRSGTLSTWASSDTGQSASENSAQNMKSQGKLPTISPDWTLVAAGQGGRQIAAISSDHTMLRRWVSGSSLTTAKIGQELGQPNFDAQGWLWIFGERAASSQASQDTSESHKDAASKNDVATSQSALWVLDTSKTSTSAPTTLPVPWLKQVVSMALSPEGDRIAFIMKDGAAERLVVAAVIRNTSGTPVALGQPFQLPVAVTAMKSLVWADANNVALLGLFEGQRQPVVVTMDGAATGLGQVPGADGLASAWRGDDGLFVHSVNGNVYDRAGAAWNSFATRAQIIVSAS